MVLVRVSHELQLLARHMRILRLIAGSGPVGIVKLSKATCLPAHQVRYSLRVLQQSSFLQPTTKGAVLNSKARKFLAGFEEEKRKLAKSMSDL